MEIKQKQAGTLKKGNYLVIDGAACIVTDLNISRPGKHGHAKINLFAVGIIDDKKRNIVMPAHANVDVPVIDKRNAQILSIHEDIANVMDTETFETFDLKIPEDMKNELTEEMTVLYWVILNDRVLKKIKTE